MKKKILRKINQYLSKFFKYTIKNDFDYCLEDYNTKDPSLKKKNLNIGAGRFYHPYWTNVDFDSDYYKRFNMKIDISYDLFSKKQLPIDDNKINLIYCSHTIEHIDESAALFLLKECYRLLKPGGGVRFTMPNIDILYNAFLRNDLRLYQDIETQRALSIEFPDFTTIEQYFLDQVASQISVKDTFTDCDKLTDEDIRLTLKKMPLEEALDNFVSKCSLELHKETPGNHISWWNYKKAKKFFKDAGFDDIYLSGYGQSAFPEMRNTSMFDTTRPNYSLYIEAKK